MGLGSRLVKRAQTSAITGLTLLIAGLSTGCQLGQPPNAKRVAVDRIDLLPVCTDDSLRVSWSLPYDWKTLPNQKRNPLYTHVQYRSPSLSTGLGVAYIHMPIPLSAKAVVWFAKSQYTSQSADGHLIDEWTDKLGRYWFEAENAKYHVRGYAVTQGFDAWIVYTGYRVTRAIRTDEIAIAAQAVDSVIPLPLLQKGSPIITRADE